MAECIVGVAAGGRDGGSDHQFVVVAQLTRQECMSEFVKLPALLRVLLSYVLQAWWKYVEVTSDRREPSYIHARWRVWQEQALRHQYLTRGTL